MLEIKKLRSLLQNLATDVKRWSFQGYKLVNSFFNVLEKLSTTFGNSK